jgi:hypothetical protein
MIWPDTELDAIRRLRVVAALTPGAFVAQTMFDADFDRVWSVASDLEHELPRYLPDVRSFRVLSRAEDRSPAEDRSRDQDRLIADARGYLGLRARFDVVLRPGWCLMSSRFLLGGMAAVAVGHRTRFAFLGGTQVRAARLAAPALLPLGRWAGDGILARLAERIEVSGRDVDG